MSHELDSFFKIWDEEAARTVSLLRTLPNDQYDFRAEPKGRSIGEMSWHLAELDGFIAYGVDRGVIDGAVNGTGRVVTWFSGVGRRVQTGLVRNYALAFLVGAAALFVYVGLRF